MASRIGVIADASLDADGGVSPNRYTPKVSAHIRVYWPPLATESEIMWTLAEAFEDARKQVRQWKEEKP